jgi:hypothetical protein
VLDALQEVEDALASLRILEQAAAGTCERRTVATEHHGSRLARRTCDPDRLFERTAAGQTPAVRTAALFVGLWLSLGGAAGAAAAPAGMPPWGRDPECETMKYYGEALGGMVREQALLVVASVLPHPGLRIQPDGTGPHMTLSWPWSLPFGQPGETSSYGHCGKAYHHRHRVVLEPGIVLNAAEGLFVRAGYRYIWHRANTRVGFGAGIGSTGELRGPDTPRASVSPELLVHYGRCCVSGYLLLSLRYDYFPGAGPGVAAASIGITYW